MRIVEVIEARRWVSDSGRTASIYGAVPYVNEADKAHWKIVSRGFTWRLDNGTVGLGRIPMSTREEAQAFMDTYNARQDEIDAYYRTLNS